MGGAGVGWGGPAVGGGAVGFIGHAVIWKARLAQGGRALRVTQVASGVRYGAYLASVPPHRRIGDYAHAAARVVNAVFKRLATTAATWAPRASAEVHTAPMT